MVYKHMLEIPVEKNVRGIDSRVLVDHENALMKQLILHAGQTVPPHQVPVDVTFFVLEGQGSITIGDSSYDVKPYSIVTCPKNTSMSVSAKSERLTFLNIKTPSYKPRG